MLIFKKIDLILNDISLLDIKTMERQLKLRLLEGWQINMR